MIFSKNDIDIISGKEVVGTNVIIERVTDEIKNRLSFTPDYSGGEYIRKEEAEKLVLELYNILKDM